MCVALAYYDDGMKPAWTVIRPRECLVNTVAEMCLQTVQADLILVSFLMQSQQSVQKPHHGSLIDFNVLLN